jgi:membrane protein implicated in regulation of membrane protease activity
MFEATYWTWLILAAVLIILEITTPIYYFLWLGITAGIVGIIAWVFPGLDYIWQLLLFSVLGLVSVVIGRTYVKAGADAEESSQLNRRAEQYLGRVLTLDKAIVNGEAQLRVDGLTWKINGPDCKEGTKVRVVSILQKSILVVELEDK